MAYQMDFFAGIESKVLAAVGSKVKYPAYVFVRDEEASETGRLAFVDQNNVLKFIRGENKQQVLNVNVLPNVADGDKEVLYIMNGIVYVFNGTEYKPTYKDHTSELEALNTKVTILEQKVEALENAEHPVVDTSELEEKVKNLQEVSVELVEKVSDLETQTESINSQISNFETDITAINGKISDLETEVKTFDERTNAVYEKVKYEVVNAPKGTLIDYYNKEIRIMCPVTTKWEKQTVGSTGNANMYYIGFKAYAPDGAVSFKEGDQGVIVDEMFDFNHDFAGTDKYGRNYSICWLAAALYDEASGEWTYFGKNSTTSKYIGWTYVVEWYDVNGIVIGSDCIKINLSNEECHYMLEPFYVSKLTSEIDTLKKTVEDLGTGSGNGNTFVELD